MVAVADRAAFIHADNSGFGSLQKRFVEDLPPEKCASLSPTSHIEYRREPSSISNSTGSSSKAPAARVQYRCSWFGGGTALWSFYESYQSNRVPTLTGTSFHQL